MKKFKRSIMAIVLIVGMLLSMNQTTVYAKTNAYEKPIVAKNKNTIPIPNTIFLSFKFFIITSFLLFLLVLHYRNNLYYMM